ncbi:tautomerase [Helicobacter didelphidarum]|uniref:Tautomerase n=1 Tax=Helicobacter didelphidarum TaxID=2040648 RepID=A0A3D8IP28_9HELI|nr:4-oxalocrotonate tautomerase family protein [Helicobacter didelphidarum]RDU66351.1 tautomerase [Helicobacter didelphidarum]
MPFVNIRITKENGEPTKEQKEELIEGVTELLAKVLKKNKASSIVIIDEIDTDNYGLGGKSITEVRKEVEKQNRGTKSVKL